MSSVMWIAGTITVLGMLLGGGLALWQVRRENRAQ